MSETIPEDIREKAIELAGLTWSGEPRAEAIEIFERFLLAERLSATERALALLNDPPLEVLQAMYEAMFTDKWDGTQAAMVGAGFDAAVAAIRSQQ